MAETIAERLRLVEQALVRVELGLEGVMTRLEKRDQNIRWGARWMVGAATTVVTAIVGSYAMARLGLRK